VNIHKDLHVGALIDERGEILKRAKLSRSCLGLSGARVLAVLLGAKLAKVGVEGTGSYGAGLARHLADAGIEVVEVNRPNRQARRRRGKSDTVDAEAAARAALNGEASVVPKAQRLSPRVDPSPSGGLHLGKRQPNPGRT